MLNSNPNRINRIAPLKFVTGVLTKAQMTKHSQFTIGILLDPLLGSHITTVAEAAVEFRKQYVDGDVKVGFCFNGYFFDVDKDHTAAQLVDEYHSKFKGKSTF